MDPSKFSEQFDAHMDSMRSLGFDFDEDNSFLQLPNQQKLVASDVHLSTHPNGLSSKLAMNLHDEGGQVGAVFFGLGQHSGNGQAELFFDSGKPGITSTKLDWYRLDGSNEVKNSLAIVGDSRRGRLIHRQITDTDIQEGMKNAGRANKPIIKPGVIKSVVSSSGISRGVKGDPAANFSRNRTTGKWEQIPD